MKEILVKFVLDLLKQLGVGALALYFSKLSGKKEILREQADKNAKAQEEFAKISAEHRTVGGAIKRLRDNKF